MLRKIEIPVPSFSRLPDLGPKSERGRRVSLRRHWIACPIPVNALHPAEAALGAVFLFSFSLRFSDVLIILATPNKASESNKASEKPIDLPEFLFNEDSASCRKV